MGGAPHLELVGVVARDDDAPVVVAPREPGGVEGDVHDRRGPGRHDARVLAQGHPVHRAAGPERRVVEDQRDVAGPESGIADEDVHGRDVAPLGGDERVSVRPAGHVLGAGGEADLAEQVPVRGIDAGHDRVAAVEGSQGAGSGRAEAQIEGKVAAGEESAADLVAGDERGERQHHSATLVGVVGQHVAELDGVGERTGLDHDHGLVGGELARGRHCGVAVEDVHGRDVGEGAQQIPDLRDVAGALEDEDARPAAGRQPPALDRRLGDNERSPGHGPLCVGPPRHGLDRELARPRAPAPEVLGDARPARDREPAQSGERDLVEQLSDAAVRDLERARRGPSGVEARAHRGGQHAHVGGPERRPGREIRERRGVPALVGRLQGEVVPGGEREPAHRHLLGASRRPGARGVGGARGLGEAGLRDGRGGVADVVPARRSRAAVVPRRGPEQLHQVAVGARGPEVGDPVRRDAVGLRERQERVQPSPGQDQAGEPRHGIGGREQRGLGLGRRDSGVAAEHQGQRPGDVRRGHRRAAQVSVARPRQRAQDFHPGSAQVDAGGPVVREVGELVVGVGGRDRHDVGQVVARGVVGVDVVVVLVVVPGRRCEQDARVVGVRDRLTQRLRVAAASPAVAHHLGAHQRGVLDGVDRVLERAAPARVQELDRHELHVPRHPGDPESVVAHRSHGPGGMGPVAVVVHRVAVVVREVPAVHVVDETVAVVVDTVARDLAGIGPHIGGQVGMDVVDPGVDHRHPHVLAAGGDVPRGWGVDVGSRRASGLPEVQEAPELSELGIVRCLFHVIDEVGLDELHLGVVLVAADRLLDAGVRDPGALGPDAGEVLDVGGPEVGEDRLGVLLAHPRAELEDDLAGPEPVVRVRRPRGHRQSAPQHRDDQR